MLSVSLQKKSIDAVDFLPGQNPISQLILLNIYFEYRMFTVGRPIMSKPNQRRQAMNFFPSRRMNFLIGFRGRPLSPMRSHPLVSFQISQPDHTNSERKRWAEHILIPSFVVRSISSSRDTWVACTWGKRVFR